MDFLIYKNMEEEIWKELEGYPGYLISSHGRAKTIDIEETRLSKYGVKFIYKRVGRMLKICNNAVNIYLQVGIANKTRKVHRLVAETFIPNPENKRCVNHIDGNKLNNHVSNLEWCTHSENAYHAHRTNLSFSYNGIQNVWSKLTREDVLEIRRLSKEERYTTRKIAALFPISSRNVSRILSGKSYKHVI